MDFLDNINMNLNELLKVVFESLPSHPSDAYTGRIYYNTTNKKYYGYDDNEWVPISNKSTREPVNNISDLNNLNDLENGTICFVINENRLYVYNSVAMLWGLPDLEVSQLVDINNNLNLPNQTHVQVNRTANQNITPSATWVKVQWQAESNDTKNEMDITTNHRFTALSGGKYLITATVLWDTNRQGFRGIAIYVNGSSVAQQLNSPPSSAVLNHRSISYVVDLSANDYVELYVYQSSGSTRTIGNNGFNSMTITKVA